MLCKAVASIEQIATAGQDKGEYLIALPGGRAPMSNLKVHHEVPSAFEPNRNLKYFPPRRKGERVVISTAREKSFLDRSRWIRYGMVSIASIPIPAFPSMGWRSIL
jgi:hypothetical protein